MIAYIFPGQGAQYIGMGRDLFEQYASAKNIFQTADKVLGYRLSKLCFEGPQDALTSTENAQPAILTTSIAALESLKECIGKQKQLSPAFVAGLSLGEYSALVAAEVLSFEDAVYLVRKRGIYMEEAARENPGKMLSIIGLDKNTVENICLETGCEIANLNCPGQVVVSGKDMQIKEAESGALAKGARAIVLAVSGAFHSSLMQPAEKKLALEIQRVKFQPAQVPIVSNVTARSERDPDQLRKNLIQQVSHSTYWQDSISFMANQGTDCFYEIGPGTVLRGLNRKIKAELKTVNLGNVEQIKAFCSEQISYSK